MLPAFGLYTHIRANRIRSWVLFASLFLLSLVLVFAIALFWRGWTGSVPLGYRHTLGGYIAGALRERGYSEEDVSGIMGGNWVALLRRTLR